MKNSAEEIILALVRHPETEGNRLSNGEAAKLERPNHLFLPTKEGEIQMEEILEAYLRMHLTPPSVTFHSTFYRTKVLAEKFGKHFDVPLIEDSRLNEKWNGILYSLSDTELREKYPDEIKLQKKIGWYHYAPPGGENGPAVEMRIRSLLRDIGESYRGKSVFLATHGNWMHLFEGLAQKLSWQEVESRRIEFTFPNCSLSVYRFLPPFEFNLMIDRFIARTYLNGNGDKNKYL